MNRYISSLLLLIGLSQLSFAQIYPLVRTELNYDRDFHIDEVYSCGENGLVVSTSTNPKRAERDPDRLYIFYDTSLIETLSLDVEVPFRQKISGTHSDQNALFTLYYDNRFGNFSVVKLDPSKEKAERFEGILPTKLIPQGFVVYNGYAVVCNMSKKGNSLVVIELKTSTFRLVPLPSNLMKNSLDLIDFRVFDNGYELGVIVKERDKRNMRSYLIVLNEDGEKTQLAELGDDKHFVVAATSNRMNDGRLVVSGTYSEIISNHANVMFLAVYDDVKLEYFRTRSFGSFNNFFEYMSDKGQNYMQRKRERHEVRGKEFDISVLMLIHPARNMGDEIVLMGEVYYPVYTPMRTTTYINGRPNTSTAQVFDGYEYSHAAMVRFNSDGKFISDYCFPISLWKRPFTLKKIVHMQTTDTSVNLAYMNFNSITSKTITSVKDVKYSYNLEAGENDQIRFTSSNIESWYGPYFLSSGYQNLKNTSNDGVSRKRDVFFLQKVEIR